MVGMILIVLGAVLIYGTMLLIYGAAAIARGIRREPQPKIIWKKQHPTFVDEPRRNDMGYNIKMKETDFTIPAANAAEALQRLKDLNHKPGVEKRGGSYAKGEKVQSWFSWMPEDYDQHVSSVAEIFSMLNFDVKHHANGDVSLVDYDDKTGQEELFLNEIADLVAPESFIEWRGEDGDMWRWTPQGVLHPHITWG